MSNLLANAMLISWRRNGEYAVRLVSDLSPEQFIAQPVAGKALNHPAWILSHLTLYAGVCSTILSGRELEDPIGHVHGMRSVPSSDPAAYLPSEKLVAEYQRVHGEAEEALASVDASIFEAPAPLQRWQATYPRVADILLMIMLKHESGHLGQLSAWRRAMGVPRVEM